MKKIYVILCLLSFAGSTEAQYVFNAYRFGATDLSQGSTARMQAIGGPQVSLGGDISAALINPAGLGFFNRSSFVISPAMDFNSASTLYGIEGVNSFDGQGTENSSLNNFNIAQIGAVIHFGKGKFSDEKFRGGSLAVSLSRANTYHLNRAYRGENPQNSIIDNILNTANDRGAGLDFLSELEFGAFNQFLINQEEGNVYTPNVGGFPIQDEIIEERGSHYQFNTAWGGNYDDVFYFGGGINAQFLNFSQARNYQEFDFLQGNQRLDSLDVLILDEAWDTRGFGVNMHVGLIYRPVQFLTVGISYTSPTFYSLEEERVLNLSTQWDPGAGRTEVIDGEEVFFDLAELEPYRGVPITNSYRLQTPSKLNVGSSFFFGKNGFLTGNLEVTNLGRSELNSDDLNLAEDNSLVEDTYLRTINVSVGGEYRINNVMMRAGYAYSPSPLRGTDLLERSAISFGLGYRTFDYFLDLSVVRSETTREILPYDIGTNQPVGLSDIQNTRVALTFGFNF